MVLLSLLRVDQLGSHQSSVLMQRDSSCAKGLGRAKTEVGGSLLTRGIVGW